MKRAPGSPDQSHSPRPRVRFGRLRGWWGEICCAGVVLACFFLLDVIATGMVSDLALSASRAIQVIPRGFVSNDTRQDPYVDARVQAQALASGTALPSIDPKTKVSRVNPAPALAPTPQH